MGHQVGVRGDCVDLVSLTDVPDVDYVITTSGGNVVSVCVCVCVCVCVRVLSAHRHRLNQATPVHITEPSFALFPQDGR